MLGMWRIPSVQELSICVKVPSTQEAESMGQEAGIIPKICVVLEDHQEGHNSIVVEVEGEIIE